MISKPFYLLLLLLCCCSQQSELTDVRFFHLNVAQAKSIDLSSSIDIVDIKKCAYPDSVRFGDINSLKKYDEHLLLGSEYSSMSLLYFKNTQFQYHLENIGSGPGEYVSLHSFCASPERDELIVYDRAQLKLIYYRLSDGLFQKDLRINKFLSNIDYLNEESLLHTSDYGSDDELQYLQITNLNLESKLSITTDYPLITEAIFPFNFSFSDKNVFYLEPFNETVYSISDTSIKAEYKFSFGDQSFPEKNWMSREIEEIESRLSAGNYAFSGHLFLKSGNYASLFYHMGIDRIHFASIDLRTNLVHHARNVSFELADKHIPWPKACYDSTYIYAVPSDEINLPPNSYWQRKIDAFIPKKSQKDEASIILIYFKPFSQ